MHKFLTVKTNSLRRNANREYTLNSIHNRNALCDACASFNSCTQRYSTRICKQFIPVLRFAVNAGLRDNTIRRNTLRVGQAWFKRLSVGDKFAMWDDINSELIYAIVDEIYWSEDKDLFLREHGKFNHMVASGEIHESGVQKLLISTIGAGFYARAFGLTAIYFHLAE